MSKFHLPYCFMNMERNMADSRVLSLTANDNEDIEQNFFTYRRNKCDIVVGMAVAAAGSGTTIRLVCNYVFRHAGGTKRKK